MHVPVSAASCVINEYSCDGTVYTAFRRCLACQSPVWKRIDEQNILKKLSRWVTSLVRWCPCNHGRRAGDGGVDAIYHLSYFASTNQPHNTVEQDWLLKTDHSQMRVFSVTWRIWRSHHTIHRRPKPHATLKLCGFVFYWTGVIADWSFTSRG